jgi:serine/threonine protein kinase
MGLFDLPDVAGITVGNGRYRLGRVLHYQRGAITVSAYDEKLGSDVVVRILPPGMGTSASVQQSIASQLLDISDTRILKYIDAEIDQSQEFGDSLIVVRRGLPTSLRQFIQFSSSTLEYVLKRTAFDIASGLEYLHRNGVVHGGLKPDNVFVQDGIWQLADFSLYRFVEPDLIPAHTKFDAQFLAPEVLHGGETTSAADVYAFGRLCIWLIGHTSDSSWNDEEYSSWQHLIALTQSPDPVSRPSMTVLCDVLFRGGARTRTRVSKLLSSEHIVEKVTAEIARMTSTALDTNREDAKHAINLLFEKYNQRPYIAVAVLEGDSLSHHAGLVAVTAAQGSGSYEYDSADSVFGGRRAVVQRRISRGVDASWRDEILRRYDVTEAVKDPKLADTELTRELREALYPSPAELVERIGQALQNADDLRAEILQEENLLTEDEALAAISQKWPNVVLSDLLQLELEGTLLVVHDHGSRLYPAFQFDPDGAIYSVILAVNELFEGSSGWAKMVWWRKFHPQLGGSPKDFLSETNWHAIVSAAKYSLDLG